MTDTRLTELVELLFELREKRSGVRKIDADYKAQQEEIEKQVIEMLETSGASAANSEAGTVTVTMTASPKVLDFPALRKYIEASPQERLDLLEKRVSKAGCKERWQIGEKVPGVEQEVESSLQYRTAKAA